MADLKPFRLDDLRWWFRLYMMMQAKEEAMLMDYRQQRLQIDLTSYLRPVIQDDILPKLWENIYQGATKIHTALFPWVQVEEVSSRDVPTLSRLWEDAFGGAMNSPEMKSAIDACGEFLMGSKRKQGR